MVGTAADVRVWHFSDSRETSELCPQTGPEADIDQIAVAIAIL